MARRLDEDERGIAEAAAMLRGGGVIVMPTDTLYGIGADATNDAAVARVFAVKGRDDDKPLLVLAAEPDDALREIVATEVIRTLAMHFWPGPLTLIAERAPGSTLARGLNPRGSSIGIRVPDRAPTRALIGAVGRPLTAPSANPTGEPPARDAADALQRLGSLVDLVLDGGACASAQASTIVDCTEASPRLVREGALLRHSLSTVLNLLDSRLR